MLNRSASLAMSTSVPKALPGKIIIKRHSPRILYLSILSTRINGKCKNSHANSIDLTGILLSAHTEYS